MSVKGPSKTHACLCVGGVTTCCVMLLAFVTLLSPIGMLVVAFVVREGCFAADAFSPRSETLKGPETKVSVRNDPAALSGKIVRVERDGIVVEALTSNRVCGTSPTWIGRGAGDVCLPITITNKTADALRVPVGRCIPQLGRLDEYYKSEGISSVRIVREGQEEETMTLNPAAVNSSEGDASQYVVQVDASANVTLYLAFPYFQEEATKARLEMPVVRAGTGTEYAYCFEYVYRMIPFR